jgi:hypothetical protein
MFSIFFFFYRKKKIFRVKIYKNGKIGKVMDGGKKRKNILKAQDFQEQKQVQYFYEQS